MRLDNAKMRVLFLVRRSGLVVWSAQMPSRAPHTDAFVSPPRAYPCERVRAVCFVIAFLWGESFLLLLLTVTKGMEGRPGSIAERQRLGVIYAYHCLCLSLCQRHYLHKGACNHKCYVVNDRLLYCSRDEVTKIHKFTRN